MERRETLGLGGAGAGDEDVDEAAGAGFPAGQGRGVEDADEGADEVVGVGLGAKIAAVDSALDEGDEGAVDEAARAFDEAHGAAGDGVHGGDDEHLAGDVVDEEQHPGAEGFERRHGGGEALCGCGELFDFAAVDGFDESVAGGEVAIERAGADAGLAGDVVEAGGAAVAGEDVFGDLKDALAVALRVRAGLAGGRRWGRRRLFWHA